MGIESRDWYRAESRRAKQRTLSRREVAIVVAVVAALVLAVSPPVRQRLGYELPLGLEEVFSRDATSSGLEVGLLPGGPTIALEKTPLYERDDPWKPWLADERTCPRGEDATAPPRIQAQVMVCLVNYARARQGLRPVSLSAVLSRSSVAKASDIVRCGRFEHDACGRPADEAARRLGHGGSFGENLYMAEGRLAAPRVALDRWLNSAGHRENLFRPEWTTMGVGLVSGADVERVRDGVVWVQQFGAG